MPAEQFIPTSVAIMSIGYVRQKTPSDKAFVNALIHFLPKHTEISVCSLNDAIPEEGFRVVEKKRIRYKNVNRLYHEPIFEDTTGCYRPHCEHSNLRNAVEINLSLLWHGLFSLRKFLSDVKPDIIHLTDSFGPAGLLLKLVSPGVPVSITKPTMRLLSSRSNVFYKLYVWSSLYWADQIITFTKASAEQIALLGISRENIAVVPWGVDIKASNSGTHEIEKVRKRYDCRVDQVLVVITDRFISRAEQQFFDKCAKLPNFRFVWAVRPTRYKESLQEFSRVNVFVENGPKDYGDLLAAADLVVSPSESEAATSTSLLPLAWIEALSRGTPVLTVGHPGAADLVNEGVNGFLAKNDDEIFDKLGSLSDRSTLFKMRPACRRVIETKFSMEVISREYGHIWQKLKRQRSVKDELHRES